MAAGHLERNVPLSRFVDGTALYAERGTDGEMWMTRCAWCGRTRNVQGGWSALDDTVRKQILATTTHGICPACAATLAPP